MTEADWLAAKDLWEMVIYISEEASYRKLKLITSALHRQIAPGLPPPCFPEEPEDVWSVTKLPGRRIVYRWMPGSQTLLRMIFGPATEVEGAEQRLDEFIPSLAHCVFGNPFRPLKVDPACVTPTVPANWRRLHTTKQSASWTRAGSPCWRTRLRKRVGLPSW